MNLPSAIYLSISTAILMGEVNNVWGSSTEDKNGRKLDYFVSNPYPVYTPPAPYPTGAAPVYVAPYPTPYPTHAPPTPYPTGAAPVYVPPLMPYPVYVVPVMPYPTEGPKPPTPYPTAPPKPTPFPTAKPTPFPTFAKPSPAPSSKPSAVPSAAPSASQEPSFAPSASQKPSSEPTDSPAPSDPPTQSPEPTTTISPQPSTSSEPSEEPTTTVQPSQSPSISPRPSPGPSKAPSAKPSRMPSEAPSPAPSRSSQPSDMPSRSLQPSETPSTSSEPSARPTRRPTTQPTPFPTNQPTLRPTSGKRWQKMGGVALRGEEKEAFGYSVALSFDAKRVAIGAPFWDYTEIVDGEIIVFENAGRISIYDWSVGERTWEEIDFPFINIRPGEKFGSDVALSSRGNRVAIRAVGFTQVWQLREPYRQEGKDLVFEPNGVRQDAGSVAISANGNRVAVGAIGRVPDGALGRFRGTVNIFDWDTDFLRDDWFSIGEINSNNLFGYSVAFSSNGDRVAIGAPAHEEQESLDPVGTVSYVNIYDRNMRTGNWDPVGQLTGIDSGDKRAADYFGGSIDLSANRIVIGAPGVSTGLFDNTGIGNYVVIYEYNGVRWIPVGEPITGERKDDLFGSSVSISANGSRVAVGAPSNDETIKGAGQVRIFDWNGVDWVQVGEDLDGVAADDEFGSSVALSGDGVRVAGGAPGPEDDPKDGYVCIFEYV